MVKKSHIIEMAHLKSKYKPLSQHIDETEDDFVIEEEEHSPVQHGDDYFTTDEAELNELCDPKSLVKFIELFKDTKTFYSSIRTDPVNGLDLRDLDKRIDKFDRNVLPSKQIKSFWKLAWEAMHDQVLILLSISAVVSFVLGLYQTFGQPQEFDPEGHPIPKVEWVEGCAIMIAILIVVLVGAANDYQKELQFAKLNAKKEDRQVIVIRNGGNEQVISIFDLLVGDIITLQTGDIIPADCVMVSGSCECDESSLTGESHSINKLPINKSLEIFQRDFDTHSTDITANKRVPDPYLISGSKLLSGLGKAVVTSVGPNSVHGRIMLSLKIEDEETPLQKRLSDLADGITKYGILAAAILFITLLVKFLFNLSDKYADLTPAQKGSKVLNMIITAITIIVIAVPEGLPLAVTLALAFATTRMAKDGNLVRVLKSCEIMGRATAICSDKTGTLTINKMKVVNAFIGDEDMEFEQARDTNLNLNDKSKLNLLSNISINSTAFENSEITKTPENPFEDSQSLTAAQDNDDLFIGSKTETALLNLAFSSLNMKNEKSLSKLRNHLNLLNIESIVQVIPFESSRKWSGIVVKELNSNNYKFYIKGAAEIIFKNCEFNDTIENKINQEFQSEVLNKINSYGEKALRAIVLAHKEFNDLSKWPPVELMDSKNSKEANIDLLFGDEIKFNSKTTGDGLPQFVIEDENDSDENSNSQSKGLIFDGLFGIKDPLRPGVAHAVEQCHRAGVTVRMVTGDNLTTAIAISKNCGILEDVNDANVNKKFMEGPVFRKLSDTEQYKIVPSLRVLARSSPEDKRRLVEILKAQKEVVAVTGDGTNDAPALKLADVGFSMGISGTEVAREASDIILMTDDFSAIVNAIKWGRCVSTSIKKFIQFQLTVNFTAVLLTFISAVVSDRGESVLTAVQLLWVNLIMDTLAALALATDKPDEEILDKKPDGRDTPLISVSTWKMIIGQSSFQLFITLLVHFHSGEFFFPGKAKLSPHEQIQLNSLTFNTFVWLQFFKLWVTRKLDEADGVESIKDRVSLKNLNFFQDFFRNGWFLSIAAIIGLGQIIIMEFGGVIFSIGRQTMGMWMLAIVLGSLSLPIGILLRIIPDQLCVKLFPLRLFNFIEYFVSFRFLSRDRVRLSDEEANIAEAGAQPQAGAGAEAGAGVETHAETETETEPENQSLNPMNIYQKWRSRSSSSLGSDSTAVEQ